MKTLFALLVIILTVFGSTIAGGHRGSSSGGHHYTSGSHRSTYTTGVPRDSHGKIKRSETAKKEFEHQTGYPHGRKGYVIDHVVPLSKGGADKPGNMLWQKKAEAKQKDRWERGQTHKVKKSKRK